MKKLNINLSDISGKELTNREKLAFRGGDMPVGGCCQCGCCYTAENGIDMDENRGANFNGGLHSPCISPEEQSCWDQLVGGGSFPMDWCGINPAV